jgi:hypothetical protein
MYRQSCLLNHLRMTPPFPHTQGSGALNMQRPSSSGWHLIWLILLGAKYVAGQVCGQNIIYIYSFPLMKTVEARR